MSRVQFNYLTHLLAVGKAGEPSCLFRCCLSVAVISKPPLPSSPLSLMIWLFLVQPVKYPQLPFILCKACGEALVLLCSDKIELEVSCGDLGLNQSSPL